MCVIMKLGVGIIGCGAISESHLRAIREQSGCEILACYDTDSAKANHRAKQFEIPFVASDAETLLNYKDLDIVAICTPPKWHNELAQCALKRGKHVLVEKPLAMNLNEADQLVEAAAHSDQVIAVALMHRYLPTYTVAREMIRSNALGTVRRVHLSFGRNLCDDDRFARSGIDPRGWLVNHRVAGGGILMSSSIHFFSVVSHLLQDPAAALVRSTLRQHHPLEFEQIEDDVEVTIRWDNEVEYIHRESWVADIPYRAEVIGDSGQLIISGEDLFTLTIHGDFAEQLTEDQRTILATNTEMPQGTDSLHFLFSHLWTDMLASVRQKTPPRLPGVIHARNMQAIVSAAYKAAVTGQMSQVDWLANYSNCAL
jgi:predicted dehydrogenase